MKAKRYMKRPNCRKPVRVTVPDAGPALDAQRPTRTISAAHLIGEIRVYDRATPAAGSHDPTLSGSSNLRGRGYASERTLT
jgi:hypothetical protein